MVEHRQVRLITHSTIYISCLCFLFYFTWKPCTSRIETLWTSFFSNNVSMFKLSSSTFRKTLYFIYLSSLYSQLPPILHDRKHNGRLFPVSHLSETRYQFSLMAHIINYTVTLWFVWRFINVFFFFVCRLKTCSSYYEFQ